MSKRTAFFGIFTSLALILSYVESFFPMEIFLHGMQGAKLGLANSMTLIMFYLADPPTAFTLLIARILLSGFMFGRLSGIFYSLAGGLFSFLMMYLAKRFAGFSVIGVSMVGGVSHNIAQLAVAMLVLENAAPVLYLPGLLVMGLVTGTLIGIISREIFKRLPPDLFYIKTK